MSIFRKIGKLVSNPLSVEGVRPGLLPDRMFIRLTWKSHMDYRLNLRKPRTYNEKLQWLKLHDRRPLYTTLVDKVAVKDWVAARIGESHVIPTIGVWNSPEEIDFASLPDSFVLKTSHDSGTVVICRDKASFDVESACSVLRKSLSRNFYHFSREWPYRDVPPRILAEPFVSDESGSGLKDYKWFCFDGVPKALFIASDRFDDSEETKFDFFDADFNHLPFTNGHPNADVAPAKPAAFERMKEMAAVLSAGIPHVRVDFYEVGGEVLFGEMTFYHWGGFVPFKPYEWDEIFGSWLALPDKKFEQVGK